MGVCRGLCCSLILNTDTPPRLEYYSKYIFLLGPFLLFLLLCVLDWHCHVICTVSSEHEDRQVKTGQDKTRQTTSTTSVLKQEITQGDRTEPPAAVTIHTFRRDRERGRGRGRRFFRAASSTWLPASLCLTLELVTTITRLGSDRGTASGSSLRQSRSIA